MTMKHDNSKPMGCSKRSFKREVYSNTILPQETRTQETRIDNLTLHLKQLEKEEEEEEQQQQQKTTKISGRKEIIKIRGEINKK